MLKKLIKVWQATTGHICTMIGLADVLAELTLV